MLPSPKNLRNHPDLILEAVEQALVRARDLESLHAFVTLLDERAHRQTAAVRDGLRRGEPLPLAGWLLAVKDNIAIQDVRLTCASKILENFTSRFTATAVERLEAAGAIVIGKTNLDEFAMGSSSENTIFGAVRNPVAPDRVAGGSSGGSAVAVAADIVHGSLGSDTGGSVRLPASFCGVCGLKPTYGRVSRYGLVAYGSSLDQIGAFAHTSQGLFDLLRVMAGRDARDSSSAHEPPPDSRNQFSAIKHSLRIGIPEEYYAHGLSADVETAVRSMISKLERHGHSIVSVSLPHTKYAIPVYYILATAEASSHLARFDGARYGFRSEQATELTDVYELTRGEGFGLEVQRRIMMGTFVLSAGYFDAYYRKAQQVRRRLLEDFSRAFSKVDVLLTPTSPTTTFRLGEKLDDPLTMYLSDVLTVPANLAGIPALSVPIGNDSQGLPIGLQIIGPHFAETMILQLGTEVEGLRDGVSS
ncbi:MAG: Asp-tRNA(Asn)/Glu-tRNA(Gln) amidotransferase subunit GatA [bacterium]|nr:Asp-tRNA(Asn)/Glu-tRNA(Gln) amidotransferase subunit GatA [bacterium]